MLFWLVLVCVFPVLFSESKDFIDYEGGNLAHGSRFLITIFSPVQDLDTVQHGGPVYSLWDYDVKFVLNRLLNTAIIVSQPSPLSSFSTLSLC